MSRSRLKLSDPPETFRAAIEDSKPFFAAAGMHGRPGRGDMRYRGQLTDPACAEGLADADYVVWSYHTPVAWKVGDGWVIPKIFYSNATAKHQHVMRLVAESYPGKYRSPAACEI